MSGPQDEPFDISKQVVWEAYKHVRANQGAAGVDALALGARTKSIFHDEPTGNCACELSALEDTGTITLCAICAGRVIALRR
jgi:hypothetical protein